MDDYTITATAVLVVAIVLAAVVVLELVCRDVKAENGRALSEQRKERYLKSIKDAGGR